MTPAWNSPAVSTASIPAPTTAIESPCFWKARFPRMRTKSVSTASNPVTDTAMVLAWTLSDARTSPTSRVNPSRSAVVLL